MISESFIKKNKEESDKIAKAISAWEAKGNRVKVIPVGVSGEKNVPLTKKQLYDARNQDV